MIVCAATLSWWYMGEMIGRAAQLAGSLNVAYEAAGRVAGDHHPSTRIYNNPYDEIAFGLLVPKFVKYIEPYLGEEPDWPMFHLQEFAREHSLNLPDAAMLVGRNGKLDEQEFPKPRLDEYKRYARLVYETGAAELSPRGDWQHRQTWNARARDYEHILTKNREWLPVVHSMPHATNLALRAMQFVIWHGDSDPAFRYAFDGFWRNTEMIGRQYTADSVGFTSDALASECIRVSNELVASDPLAKQKGEFFDLDPEALWSSGRAISQILALGYLKVAESKDLDAAACMSDVAYCGWAMMHLGDMERYVDAGLDTDLLESQWKLGINAEPHALHFDQAHRDEKFQELITQVTQPCIAPRRRVG